MTDTNRLVHSKNLPCFEETLWEWVHLCERDARLEEWKDAPWWYNETTSVSVFAGAIWRTGGTALSDFATKRFDVESPERKETDKSRHGRCDLYFRSGGEEYYAEAKQVWSPFGLQADTHKAKEMINANFIRANSQLDRLDEVETETKIALVFIAPYISTSYLNQADRLLEKWKQALREMEYDALAWTFPLETRQLEDKGRDRYFPGVALMIREFKQQHTI